MLTILNYKWDLVSYITPRKYHYKQDKNEVDEVDKFKKN